jgi:hypothetical protein
MSEKRRSLPGWSLSSAWDPVPNGTTLGITGLLDCVHRPEFQILENTTFRKPDLFPSSGERGGGFGRGAGAYSIRFPKKS